MIYDGKQNDILSQYVLFTKICGEQMRLYGRSQKAILEAIRICKNKNVLKEYLESERYEVRQQSLMEGRQEGLKEGLQKGRLEMVRRMLCKGKYSLEEIADCVDLPLETVKKLKLEMEHQ